MRDKISGPIPMKKFKDSQKVMKSVRSMIETRGDGKLKKISKNRGKTTREGLKKGSHDPLATRKTSPAGLSTE